MPRLLHATKAYCLTLAATLRELGGPATIPHELTQNADDAESATRIRFTVTDAEFVVWNDGTFTDCHVDQETCLWDPVCNLHAFGRFAGRTNVVPPALCDRPQSP